MFYQYYKSPLFSTIAHDKHLQIAFHCSRIITAVLVFSPSLSLSIAISSNSYWNQQSFPGQSEPVARGEEFCSTPQHPALKVTHSFHYII